MWMHDLPYLPRSTSAPMASWMGMWMHIHGIEARNKHKNPNLNMWLQTNMLKEKQIVMGLKIYEKEAT